MILNAKKKWTILIYSNGNNDLEPEMRYAMKEIESVGEVQNVQVVLQIGRESFDLVNIVRAHVLPPGPYESWEGVRRYILQGNRLELLNDLGSVNMAHPSTLLEFLDWGFALFPAEQYMLIVGGHSWQYLGTMTDYSQREPYLMGIPGLVGAINKASIHAGVQVDLLIMDTCNFNVIEVVYELGADPCHAVKNMVTYMGAGPLHGLSCRAIIQETNNLSHINDIQYFIKCLIRGLGHSLVACEINHSQLGYIKELYNRLAIEYCNTHRDAISMEQIIHGNSADLWYDTLINLKENLRKLLISATNLIPGQGIINVASQRTKNLEKIKLYSMLSFAKDNSWTRLLYEGDLQEDKHLLTSQVPFQPVRLSENEICRYISLVNPGLSTERTSEIFVALAKFKHWTLNG